jgi:hypothetical protein
MVNFIIVPPRDYVAELLRMAPRFEASEHYQSLSHDDRSVAGLVFSCFARFFEDSSGDRDALNEALNAIEQFASGSDSHAHNLLITEIYESFRTPTASSALLLPRARELYRRWIGD